MKRYLPLFVLGIGMLLVFLGFTYDVMFAGIPYQDPTPEMSARYAHHAQIASVIYRVGGCALLFGAAACAAQFLFRRFSKRRDS